MHPINKFLSFFGWQLYKSKRQAGFPLDFRIKYGRDLKNLEKNPPEGWKVIPELMYENGTHPENYVDYECEFAARHIKQGNAKNILDIGSYRHFIIGLLANYSVTTIDVRSRNPVLQNERAITCDAKKIASADNFFDVVVSLCAIEHFGLGRYGDEIDFDADKKALNEMVRVLKPGGRLIITTELYNGQPVIAFNAHRIYTAELFRKMCEENGLICEDEAFYSRVSNSSCRLDELTDQSKQRGIYLGCWKK